ncbi:MAG: ABC transporter substrate-binding protein [Candidatus Thioglobus sp.]|nr:ABC transporter substrate-binding protein [Candidatus Thioglobus sp.]
MNKYLKIVCLTLSMGMGFGLSSIAKADGHSVMFASWGGSFQDALRTTMLTPAAEKLGIEVEEDTTNGIQDVRSQISAGAVSWDVTEQELSVCETLKQEDSLEPLDYSLINSAGIPPELVNSHYVGLLAFTKVISYRQDKFGDNGPQSWADFWNVEKFPGKRGMHGKVNYNLEAALMADGVAKSEIYNVLSTKEGLERAWDKLAEIVPHVTVWYRGGSQSAQILRDGEVDVVHMGHNRVESVANSGVDVAYTFQDGTMDVDCLLVPKGAPNYANAMKLINSVLSASSQATLAKTMPLGPVNKYAFDAGVLSIEQAKNVNTHPDNYDKQLLVDPNFYIGQLDVLTERFDTLIQQ